MDNLPLVSIIIVNYNGKKYLEECLKSLKKVTYPKLEIILVDNQSSDDSIEFTNKNYPLIKIIKLDKNYGFAYPNNIGASRAKGELILFLNNDTKVDPLFVTELVKIIQHDSKVAICQSMLLKPNGEVDSSGDFIDSIGIAFSSKEKLEDTREILSAKGASMIIRKCIFDELKGFDEKFFASFEDVDLGWRAWIFGYKVIINPKSIVYHIGGQTTTKLRSELIFHGIKNQLSMKITNFETKFMISSIFLYFAIYTYKTLASLFDYKFRKTTKIKISKYENNNFQKPNFKLIIKSLLWICRNCEYLYNKKKWINSHRIYSTRLLQQKKIIV